MVFKKSRPQLGDYWYQGKAELSRYELAQNRYLCDAQKGKDRAKDDTPGYGDARMIGTRHPERFKAAHVLETDKDILDGVIQRFHHGG